MKIITHIAVIALICLLGSPAYAKITYASGTANAEISLGYSNDRGYLDFNGDGKVDSDSGILRLRIVDRYGAPDVNNIVRHTQIRSRVFAYYNPLTGAELGRSAMGMFCASTRIMHSAAVHILIRVRASLPWGPNAISLTCVGHNRLMYQN